MRGVIGASKAQTAVFDRTHRPNRLATALRSQALSVVAIGALLATTLVLSHETPAEASTPDCGELVGGVHQVTDAAQLAEVGRSGGGTGNCQLGAKYRLMNSITLSDNWTPIPGSFTGEFDGGGHEIRGLSIDVTDGHAGMFFDVANGAQIRNLRLLDVDVKGNNGAGALVARDVGGSGTVISNVFISGKVSSTNSSAGGLAGYVGSGVKIENVRSEAEVTCGGICGGLVWQMDDGATISRSFVGGKVTFGTDEAGGLVGILGSGATISYSVSTAQVQSSGSASNQGAGGLVGNLRGTVKDSYARGVVEAGAGDRPRGGFTGIADGGSIQRGYSTGEVSPQAGTDVGGFIGALRGTAPTVTASVWDTQTSGLPNSAGGAGVDGRTSAQMTSFDTFASPPRGWAIVEGWEPFDAPRTVWGICPAGSDNVVNDGYPFLLWEYDSNPCVNEPDTVLGGGSEPGAATPVEKRAASPAIHLDLQANVGDRVAGAPVIVGGEGLSAGSSLTLVVRSTPQTLVSGRVSSLGNFSTRASLPALSPGSHTLTLTGTAPDGAVLTLVQGFVVGADGTFTSIGQPAGSQTGGLAATGVPANAGVLFAVSSLMLLAIGLSLLRARSRHQFTE